MLFYHIRSPAPGLALARVPSHPCIAHDRPSPHLASLRFDGHDAASFLHNQLSTDVEAMAIGDAGWTATTAQGRMLASPLLWRRSQTEFIAYVPSASRSRCASASRCSCCAPRYRSPCVRAGLTGVVGPDAGAILATACDRVPAPGHAVAADTRTSSPFCSDGRYLVDGRTSRPDRRRPRRASHWGGSECALRAANRARNAGPVRAADRELRSRGRRQFQEGLLPGRRSRPHALPWPPQGAHVRVPRRADPPAPALAVVAGSDNVGTVVNAALAPSGGSDLLAVVSFAALANGGLQLADGGALTPIPMPYEIPAPSAPNRVKL